MKKLIQSLTLKLLVLDVLIMGRRIKNNAWRRRLLSYIDNTYRPLDALFIELFTNYRKNDVAYLVMEKIACTSFKLLLSKKSKRNRIAINKKKNRPLTCRLGMSGFSRKDITLEEINSYYIFTFVRNPFTKWISFFQDKYEYKNAKHHHKNKKEMSPLLRKTVSFDHLTARVSRMPDHYLEWHTLPQHIRIDNFTRLGGKVDFIGKFETLEQDFEKIRQKFDLPPLEHRNKSIGNHRDWRNYYTPKTAKMIFDRYRKDFERFGYKEEYPKLLDYLATKTESK